MEGTLYGEKKALELETHAAQTVVLEGQSTRDLDCSRLIHLRCGDNSKCRGARVGVRHVEPRMIEDVESVHPQLEFHRLCELKVFVDPNICLVHPALADIGETGGKGPNKIV